jgi:hypothetical protein
MDDASRSIAVGGVLASVISNVLEDSFGWRYAENWRSWVYNLSWVGGFVAAGTGLGGMVYFNLGAIKPAHRAACTMVVGTASLLLGEFLKGSGWLLRRDFRATCCSLLVYASCVTFGFGETALLCELDGTWGWRGVGALCTVGTIQMCGGVLMEMRGWLRCEGYTAAACLLTFFGGLALNFNGFAIALVLYCGSIAAAFDVVSVAAKAVLMLFTVKHMMHMV